METNGTKPLTIAGADGQPIAIEAGAYYLNPKARCQRIMREPLSSEANRVHACLEMATMGFRQELAVKLDRGRQVPLTRRDIAQQTGLKLQNVSRALSELEDRGLAERRNKGDTQTSRFVIYSWALPHEPKAAKRIARDSFETGNESNESNQVPPSIKRLIVVAKRLKLKIDLSVIIARDSTFEEGERIARDYAEVEKRIARYFENESRAIPHIRKKERKDRTTKDTPPPPPSSSSVQSAEPTRPKAEEEEERTVPFESFQKLYPHGRLDQAKAKPLFDALTSAERKAALSWLEQHRDCPRWLDQAGRWIPLSSTFLRERQFLHPPPPAFDAAANGVQTPISRFDQKAHDFARRYRAEQEKKSRGS